MKIAIVIPCFNESGAILEFLGALEKLRVESGLDLTPVVVNDCSTDDTLERVAQSSAIVLNLPINLGIGGAVQTGFRYAYKEGFDVAVQMDGDGQHPATELPKLLTPFSESGATCDIVIGSRFIEKQGFQSTLMRRVGIVWFATLLRLLTRQKVTDPTSGFRALNRKALAITDRFYPVEYPEPEILVHLMLKDLKVLEVPVLMQGRLSGVSSIRSWKSVYYMLKVTLGILFSYIRLKVYDKH